MKSFTITKWNAPKLVGKIPKILKEYGSVLGPQLREEITAKNYDWPRFTVRKSGEEVPKGKRNIVDLGILRDSQGPALVKKAVLTITYGADYSDAVLKGYIDDNGGIQPGRNWMTPALEAQPLLPYFVSKWKELKIS